MSERLNVLLESGWKVNAKKHLEKLYLFKNFQKALEFTIKVAEISEQKKHHPEITLSWGKVSIELWTHSTQNLTDKDVELAFSFNTVYLPTNQ